MRFHMLHRCNCAIVIILTVFAAGRAQAAESKVSVSLSKETVQIAEPFDVHFSVRVATGSRVDFPPIGERMGELEIVRHRDQSDVPDEDDKGMRVWNRTIRLESLATGSVEVPAQNIYVSQGTSTEILRTKAQLVEVLSVLEDRANPLKFRDLKDAVELAESESGAGSWKRWAWGGLAGLAIAATLVGVIAVRRKRLQITPQAWASRQLSQLRADVAAAGETPQILAGLESTLRIYIESQFGIPATTQGRSELTAAVRTALPLPDDRATPEQCERLLRAAEQAKYAGRSFERVELMRFIDDAEQIVQQLETLAPTLAESGGAA
jgi:hypothetical protein